MRTRLVDWVVAALVALVLSCDPDQIPIPHREEATYEITDAIEEVLAKEVDHETGEITDETLEKLEALEISRDEKALAVAAYLKGELAEAEAVSAEAKRLTLRARRHASRAERLKNYLAGNLPVGTKLRDARSEIGWRKSQGAIAKDGSLPPEAFLKPQPPKIDVAAIRSELLAGRTVEGWSLEERWNIQIR